MVPKRNETLDLGGLQATDVTLCALLQVQSGSEASKQITLWLAHWRHAEFSGPRQWRFPQAGTCALADSGPVPCARLHKPRAYRVAIFREAGYPKPYGPADWSSAEPRENLRRDEC